MSMIETLKVLDLLVSAGEKSLDFTLFIHTIPGLNAILQSPRGLTGRVTAELRQLTSIVT